MLILDPTHPTVRSWLLLKERRRRFTVARAARAAKERQDNRVRMDRQKRQRAREIITASALARRQAKQGNQA